MYLNNIIAFSVSLPILFVLCFLVFRYFFLGRRGAIADTMTLQFVVGACCVISFFSVILSSFFAVKKYLAGSSSPDYLRWILNGTLVNFFAFLFIGSSSLGKRDIDMNVSLIFLLLVSIFLILSFLGPAVGVGLCYFLIVAIFAGYAFSVLKTS